MKMKSYFFGLNAKVALALLAISGTVLTGCYEKEDGDVPIPFTKPDPVYVISGVVTDQETNLGLAGVTVTVSTISGTTKTTDTNGSYEFKTSKADGNAVVTFTKTGYETVTKQETIATIGKGESAVYVVSATMKPEGYVPALEVTVTTIDYGRATDDFTVASHPEKVDIINNTNQTIEVPFTVTHNLGAAVEEALSSSDFEQKIATFLKGVYGQDDITTIYPTTTTNYNIHIGSLWALESVTAVTFYKKSTYEFKLDANTKTVIVYEAYKCEFSNVQVAKGHGTGHGHGHGGGLNAGGGIITPIN